MNDEHGPGVSTPSQPPGGPANPTQPIAGDPIDDPTPPTGDSNGVVKTVVLVAFSVVSAAWLVLFVLGMFVNRLVQSGDVLQFIGMGVALLAAILGMGAALGYPKLNALWSGLIATSFIGGILTGLVPIIVEAVRPSAVQNALGLRFVVLDETPMVNGWKNYSGDPLKVRSTREYPDDMNLVAGLLVVSNPTIAKDQRFHVDVYGSMHTVDGYPAGSFQVPPTNKIQGALGDNYYKNRYSTMPWLYETIKKNVPEYETTVVIPYFWDSQLRVLSREKAALTFFVNDALVEGRGAVTSYEFNGTWNKLGPSIRLPQTQEIRRGDWPAKIYNRTW